MDLREYFFRERITQTEFLKKAKISSRTLWKAINGKDIMLSLALRIQKATDDKVRCEDLYQLENEDIKK